LPKFAVILASRPSGSHPIRPSTAHHAGTAGLFSLITLWADGVSDGHGPSVRTAGWYQKSLPTFGDALATVRQRVWSGGNSRRSRSGRDVANTSASLLNTLIISLATLRERAKVQLSCDCKRGEVCHVESIAQSSVAVKSKQNACRQQDATGPGPGCNLGLTRQSPDRAWPVAAVRAWRDAAEIKRGLLLHRITRYAIARDLRALTPLIWGHVNPLRPLRTRHGGPTAHQLTNLAAGDTTVGLGQSVRTGARFTGIEDMIRRSSMLMAMHDITGVVDAQRDCGRRMEVTGTVDVDHGQI
jgi:hypothetical protein